MMWEELIINSVTVLQANAAVEPTLWVETVAGIGNCCNLTISYNCSKSYMHFTRHEQYRQIKQQSPFHLANALHKLLSAM